MEENKYFTAVINMFRTHKMHKQLLDMQVSDFGMCNTQHRILMHIARNKKLDSQKSLAEHFGVTPAAITGALQKLEKDGYIKRIQGTDNRYNEVEITESGRRIVEETKVQFSEIDRRIFENFSADEIEQYTSYLERIQENIKQISDSKGEV